MEEGQPGHSLSLLHDPTQPHANGTCVRERAQRHTAASTGGVAKGTPAGWEGVPKAATHPIS